MAKVRVYLAQELGVDSRRIMARLTEMGEFVRSASSTLEPSVSRRLRADPQVVCRKPLPLVTPPVSEDGLRAAAAAFAGIDPSEVKLRGKKASKRAPHRSLPRESAAKSSAGLFAERQARRNAKRLAATEVRWAKNRLMEPREVQAWLDAGLGEYDDAIAEQCLVEGLAPKDLAVRVDGLTAGARMRGGETVASVVARMKELGLLAG